MTHLKYLHDHPKGCGPLVEDLIESMLFFSTSKSTSDLPLLSC